MLNQVKSLRDESPKLFKNKWLDHTSRVHFLVPLFLFLPVIIYFLYQSFFVVNVNIALSLVLISMGFLWWTLIEYLMHRFLFHHLPSSKFGFELQYLFHGIHHAYPNDSKRLVMVPVVSVPGAFLIYGLCYLIMGPILEAPFLVGFLGGYLAYDMAHYACHHAHFKMGILRKLQKHHMNHHFVNNERGFGITSTFWDRVFETGLSLPLKSFTRIEKER